MTRLGLDEKTLTVPSSAMTRDASHSANSQAKWLRGRDGSFAPGRRRFSLLHEYGHHLRNQVVPVLEALWAARKLSTQLEEKVCDAFASFILIPAPVRAAAFTNRVTARAVLDLMATSSASDQAVAVAAA